MTKSETLRQFFKQLKTLKNSDLKTLNIKLFEVPKQVAKDLPHDVARDLSGLYTIQPHDPVKLKISNNIWLYSASYTVNKIEEP